MTTATLQIPQRKTKIVATLGPASNSTEIIGELIDAGINVARLNFSHGTHEEHEQTLTRVRTEAKKRNRYVAVLQDLGGPKVRIGEIAGGEAVLADGEEVYLRRENGGMSSAEVLSVDAFDPADIMSPGEKALLSDGNVVLVAEGISTQGVKCRVMAGGTVRSRSGIAVPDSKLSIPCLTAKDIEDLKWGIANKVDYVALSFVNDASDILSLRDLMAEHNADIPVIAKIERRTALEGMQDIISTTDCVMVARGDLGVELPLERVPIAQKLIIERANVTGTPAITATQMLQSMVTEIRPTRAEVSDVCTAVFDGTDAVMLSEETAIGKHPVRAVQTLAKIVREAEKEYQYETHKPRLKGADPSNVTDAVCLAACSAAAKISASAIVACTNSGFSAKLVAKYRPQQPLFGASANRKTLARIALYWGVEPIFIPTLDAMDAEEEIVSSVRAVRDQYGLKPGSRVIITAGLRAQRSGSTSLMEIREIPRNGKD